MNLQNQLNYLPSLLDVVSVPAPLSKELTQSAIMIRCGLLTPVYSEPETMKAALDFWFRSHQWNIEHLLAIVQAEYSPIENTDRYDDWTRKIDTDKTGSSQNARVDTGTYSDSTTGRTDTETSGTTSGSKETVTDRDTTLNRTENGSTSGETDTTAGSTTEHTVSAYNTSTYQADSKDTASSTGHEESTGTSNMTIAETGTDDSTVTETDSGTSSGTGSEERTQAGSGQHNNSVTDTGSTAGTEDTTETYTQHLHGNIGVTTNQQMITEEYELMKVFNIYDQIAAMIESEFFLGVY